MGDPRLGHDDIAAGIKAMPEDGVSIGRVLARSDTEQLVLRGLLDLQRERDVAITMEAEAVAECVQALHRDIG